MIDEVLVARIALAFMRGSSRANSSCLASAFSKMASMMTSAPGTPSPATSGVSRVMSSAAFAGIPEAFLEALARALAAPVR